MAIMAPKKKQHYVDNKKFLEELVKYRKRVHTAKERGLKKPRITEYIGECFLKIATHLSYRPNFINYMYKDDMIGDGIESSILITLTQQSLPIHSHTLLKSSTMHI